MVRLEVASRDLDSSASQHCTAAVKVTATGARKAAAPTTSGAAAYPATAAAAAAFAAVVAAQSATHGGTLTDMGGTVGDSSTRYVSTDQTGSSRVQNAVAV